MHDLIERQAAIDAHYEYCNKHPDAGFPVWSLKILEDLPSAQPEIKPISYEDCANAMLMMWMDNVLTDGEYNRIMDKLNKFEAERKANG